MGILEKIKEIEFEASVGGGCHRHAGSDCGTMAAKLLPANHRLRSHPACDLALLPSVYINVQMSRTQKNKVSTHACVHL